MHHAGVDVALAIGALAVPVCLLTRLTFPVPSGGRAELPPPSFLAAPFGAVALPTVATDAYRKQNSTASDTELLKLYGGTSLRIVQFYAPSGSDMAGKPPLLCYGVLNAKSVRIEPPVKDVWVSLSRCVEVSPAKDTRYKLIAEGHDGKVVEAEVLAPARR